MNAVNAEGWRIVALCRLASPIPSTIQNAIFGLTRIALWPYTWATFVFTIPQIILYVYLGAIGKAALLGESGGVNLGVMIAGGLTFLVVVLLITRRVRASMRNLESRPSRQTGALQLSFLPVGRARNIRHRNAVVDRLAALFLGFGLLLRQREHVGHAVARHEAHAGLVRDDEIARLDPHAADLRPGR